jgi:hypothetical protein
MKPKIKIGKSYHQFKTLNQTKEKATTFNSRHKSMDTQKHELNSMNKTLTSVKKAQADGAFSPKAAYTNINTEVGSRADLMS